MALIIFCCDGAPFLGTSIQYWKSIQSHMHNILDSSNPVLSLEKISEDPEEAYKQVFGSLEDVTTRSTYMSHQTTQIGFKVIF